MIDGTHDPSLESWVASANDPLTDFPIQNLPFGRFRVGDGAGWRRGVAIGDQILDLTRVGLVADPCSDDVIGWTPSRRRALRATLVEGLARGSRSEASWREALVPIASATLGLPCEIRGYTDFYAGIHHAMAVGKLMRPDNPLLPNYKWVPIGYHGRVSSIVPSGAAVVRPRGQLFPPGAEAPFLAPTKRLDYELEMGIVVGPGNELGTAVPMTSAEAHVVGLTLLNDWSARDVQAWEYQPLGPFLAKNFATTLSPWIVTLEALAPYRRPFTRPLEDPAPLPYLDSPENRAAGHVAVSLEVWLTTERMRRDAYPGHRMSASSYLDAYWTLAQLVAHHTVNGCNLQSGDILGTGTLSGSSDGQGGSLLELSLGGKRPLALGNGEERAFLQDGDEVKFVAHCEAAGFRRIGFGACTGTIRPATQNA